MADWRSFSIPKSPSGGDDAHLALVKDDYMLCAVADGVGSFSGASKASAAVIECVRENVAGNRAVDFVDLFGQAKERLIGLDTDLKLGTTLTVMQVDGGIVRFGHVGDCRIYHLRNAGIVTKTSDQTELNYLLQHGILNKYEALSYHRAHVLLSVMAPDKKYDLQLGSFEVFAGDRLILCSDGFYGVMQKSLLRDISVENEGFVDFSEKIYDRLSGSELTDDATAIILQI